MFSNLCNSYVEIGDIRVKGDVILSIRRANISTKKCSYPECRNKNDLHQIPLNLRFELLKNKRYYIPKLVKACLIHLYYEAWAEANLEGGVTTFTAEQIEDMVDMLRAEKKRAPVSGMSINEIMLLVM